MRRVMIVLMVGALLLVQTTAVLADTYTGTSGDDFILGSTSDDIMSGKGGNDDLYGRIGNDILYGDSGNDYLFGAMDNDTLYGGSGNDTLEGADGTDTYYGGPGDDVIEAFDGVAEIIDCGPGYDTVTADVNDTVASNCESVERMQL